MKKAICLCYLLIATLYCNAQLTFQHTYPSSAVGNLKVVDLLLSGRKYCVQTSSQTILYNLDHSIWKTINYPVLPGLYPGAFGIENYISENLFKIDNKVDMVISYGDSSTMSTGTGPKHYVIFDEDGLIINDIDSVDWDFEIHNIGVDSFVAFVTNFYASVAGPSISVYSLPGTLPCNLCGAGPGLGIANNPGSGNSTFLSAPIPNPSSSQVKIEYKLKPGTSAEIYLFNTTGKLIHTYKVDSTFDYITLDNSDLPSGVYYYKIVTSDMQTSAKKMIVIK